MSLIRIHYTYFDKQLDEIKFKRYLSQLSSELIHVNTRYINWKNKYAHLFGKLLLLRLLEKCGVKKNIWNHIQYNKYQRPYLKLKDYDFNISHSGNYVICAMAENIRVGIDIEENRKINFDNFQTVMTPSQWRCINSSASPINEFYKYWTIKESVVKADGRGFSIPFEKLEVENETVRCDGNLWFVQQLEIDSNYTTSLATNSITDLEINEVDFFCDN